MNSVEQYLCYLFQTKERKEIIWKSTPGKRVSVYMQNICSDQPIGDVLSIFQWPSDHQTLQETGMAAQRTILKSWGEAGRWCSICSEYT